MVPDLHAMKMLRKAGVVVPEITTESVVNSSGKKSQFGLMSDIRASPNVADGMALHALAYGRNPALASSTFSGLSGFGESLGYVMEMSRRLGIQDRHGGNIFVLKMKDGSIKVGMIDLDIVSCYPAVEGASSLYSGYLKDQITALSHATGKDFNLLYSSIRQSFLKGVNAAAKKASTIDFRDYVYSAIAKQNGKPVGWGRSPKAEEISPKTANELNGKIQDIIKTGSDAGRFILDGPSAERSFDTYGMVDQAKFWNQAFDLVPSSLGHAIAF